MTPEQAIRFLAAEAGHCRSRDLCEALCLLAITLPKALALPPMTAGEQEDFRRELRARLRQIDKIHQIIDPKSGG